jgi:glycosyltransferase involved in cell wall biosynthesis
MRVVTHPVNRGYGGAIRSGLEAASKEFIFYTDGDGQYDPGEMVKLLEAMAPDVGTGERVLRRGGRTPGTVSRSASCTNRFARFLFPHSHPRYRLRLPADSQVDRRPAWTDLYRAAPFAWNWFGRSNCWLRMWWKCL